MSVKFESGEKVSFLYETGGGVVISQMPNSLYQVEDDSGFERTFQASELVKIHGFDYKISSSADLHMNEDETLSTSTHYVLKENELGSKKSMDVWEIDLHIDMITESNRGMSNFQMLTKQLSEFKAFFKKAKSKNIRKIVVIHGVGEGVLKEEIRSYLSKQEGIEYYDADFREYGKGATTVEIHYNYK
jgi:hypothetical protein